MAIRRRRATPQSEQANGATTVRVFARTHQPAASTRTETGKYCLRGSRNVTTMDREHGREKIKTLDRGDYCAQAELFGHGRVRQGSADGVYSSVCGRGPRKPNSSCERKWNSPIQDFEYAQWNRDVSRNGNSRHIGVDNKKYILKIYFNLDIYNVALYINPHNNPTKNKKARLAPGFEVNRKSIPDLRLSPLLFAVNQKLGE